MEERRSSSPITTFLDHYKSLINKYEDLLVKNTEINTLLKDKLDHFPTEININQMIEGLMEENEKKKNILIEDLKHIVDKLIYKFNTIMIWLLVGSTIGGIAIVYVKFIISAVPKEKVIIEMKEKNITDQQINDMLKQPHIDYIDKDGNRVIIPILISNNQEKSTIK